MQILVVVANIQMRTLKAEEEKGSMRTAIGHGLLDPKIQGNHFLLYTWQLVCPISKGNQVNIPEAGCGFCGNTYKRARRRRHGPLEELSFLFNSFVVDLEICLAGEKVYRLVEHSTFCYVRCIRNDP